MRGSGPRQSMATTSKRQGDSVRRSRERKSSAISAMRRRFTRLMASAPPPKSRPFRVFTSTNTTVCPSRATMSNSPPRRRYRRARIAYPSRSSSRHAKFSPDFPSCCLDSVMLPRGSKPCAKRSSGTARRQRSTYFRFQRVPAAESSRMMPRAARSSRMRSPAAKSRRRRAACRSSMS